MASPTAMPKPERKRQYAALRRAIVRSCEPALLAKFSLSTDAERPGYMIYDLRGQNIFDMCLCVCYVLGFGNRMK